MGNRLGDERRPIWAVVTARMSSSRLPGKSMTPLAGRPALRHLLDRLNAVDLIDGVAVATTTRIDDEPIRTCARDSGVRCVTGSLEDVLSRVAKAARELKAGSVVLATGDCPLLDPKVVQLAVTRYLEADVDYASTVLTETLTYPAGYSVEVFRARLLQEIDATSDDPADREHVTAAFYRHPERYRLLSVESSPEQARPDLWLSVDTARDRDGVARVFDALYAANPLFGYDEVLALLDAHPELVALNAADGRR